MNKAYYLFGYGRIERGYVLAFNGFIKVFRGGRGSGSGREGIKIPPKPTLAPSKMEGRERLFKFRLKKLNN